MKTHFTYIIITLMLCIASTSAQQYYLLQAVTGTGGGSYATSSGYKMDNTIGAPGNGSGSSTGYTAGGGFWYQYEPLQGYFSPDVILNNGWNLLAVSPVVADFRKSQVYPSAASNAFAFAPGTGYYPLDTLENGTGFWLKFAVADTLTISGTVRTSDTVEVQAGWNMIGSVSLPVDTGAIVSNPPGIRGSAWYGYEGSYNAATALLPGKGYWVKASAPGSFILAPSAGPPVPALAKAEQQSAEMDEFVVKEKSGVRRALYLESELTAAGAMSELPPPGPEGTFDARFESQKSIESISENDDKVILVRSSEYPVTFTWNLHDRAFTLRDGMTGTLLPPRRISRTGELTITNPAVSRLILTSEEEVPHVFALFQNYPNPFNPSTEIKFSVEKTARTSLEVYSVLGQRVTTLFNENAEPGKYYTVRMDGLNMASGVYFYTLTSGARVDTRKMLLLK